MIARDLVENRPVVTTSEHELQEVRQNLGCDLGVPSWQSLALLLLPTAVVALDINVLFLAVPALTADLDATAVQQLRITPHEAAKGYQ